MKAIFPLIWNVLLFRLSCVLSCWKGHAVRPTGALTEWPTGFFHTLITFKCSVFTMKRKIDVNLNGCYFCSTERCVVGWCFTSAEWLWPHIDSTSVNVTIIQWSALTWREHQRVGHSWAFSGGRLCPALPSLCRQGSAHTHTHTERDPDAFTRLSYTSWANSRRQWHAHNMFAHTNKLAHR